MAYKPKILIVDKDPASMRVMEATLKVMGAAPKCFSSAKQAAEVILKEKFDGAFLDWDTRDLNGEELTKRIRESKSNASITIAMLTSKADTKSIAAGFKAGVNFFLAKPVGAQELGRLLNVTRGAMLEERRRYQRSLLKVEVTVSWADKEITAQGVNISTEGVLLTMNPRPEVGAGVSLDLVLPGGDNELTLKGSVTRHAAANQVGIKFVNIPGETKDVLKRYADKHQPGGPTMM